ncbi:MAG: putative signal transducing protein [Trueperaceae bacterium]
MKLPSEPMTINGDKWRVVNVAPAEPLAEMIAVMLEREGFPVLVRGTDVFSHLGASEMTPTYVLVPEKDAARAVELIEELVSPLEEEE